MSSMSEQQLLYILPEVAFTVKLQETPKQDYFFVQAFHQINGQFMNEDNFVFENLKKLFERIEEGKYTLVLPDFLFTDTIVSVPKTEDMAIAEYLRDELLPKIEVSTFSHETRTSVLLQRGKTSKVQLSAFEKELAALVKLAVGKREIEIDEIVPLSWTLKAAVTLEPSVTIVQAGERLYLAEHFVGINQTENTVVGEPEKLVETVKTLKGADPNLQMVYLLTSSEVEKELEKLLTKVLPIQQLTEEVDGETQMPAYVKQMTEIAGRTLVLPEFVVPRFDLAVEEISVEKKTEEGESETEAMAVETLTAEDEPAEETILAGSVEETEEKEKSAETKDDEELPPPATVKAEALVGGAAAAGAVGVAAAGAASATLEKVAAAATAEVAGITAEETLVGEEDELTETSKVGDDFLSIFKEVGLREKSSVETAEKTSGTSAARVESLDEERETVVAPPESARATEVENSQSKENDLGYNSTERSLANKEEREKDREPSSAKEETRAMAKMTKEALLVQEKEETPEKTVTVEEEAVDLSFFKPKTTTAATAEEKATVAEEKAAPAVAEEKVIEKTEKKGKKKGSMGKFFKRFFLFLLIFVITIALGIGVGLAILKLTGKDFFNKENLPTPEPTLLPTPISATLVPEASGAAEASASGTTATEVEEEAEKEELDLTKLNVLVVNATGIAGYAGETKTALEKEGFTKVKTGNSKGTYDDKGVFVLMADKNSALIKALETGSGKTLIYDEDYQTEDPNGTYDAVIVLNDKTKE